MRAVPDSGVVWFPSKVDWWLGILLACPPVGSLVALGAGLASSDPGKIAVGAIACVLVSALYALLVIPVRYGIGPEELIVRFGVVRQRVKLGDIEEVAPTRNPLSSPALSLDRLAIRAGPGFLSTAMISPADREAFLLLLAAKGRLRRDGDRLVRE